MERRADGRTLMKDEGAVSPVIGVILMIAITVVIAAVVASFAYGIIGGVSKAPNAALVIENADADKTAITLIHHGGETISEAFKNNATAWNNMILKFNGVDLNFGNVTPPIGDNDNNFESGEQLKITVPPLKSGDTVSVVYIPSGNILQRVKVA